MQSLGRPSNGLRPPRRDPAPSRWAYRWQRMWLTPMFRFGFRYLLPLAVTLAMGAAVWADKARAAALTAQVAGLRSMIEGRPEFQVAHVAIEGASPDLADAVRAKLNIALPISSFDLDLAALRAVAEGMDAVAEARVQIRAGGVLTVELTEREPALVWRSGETLELLDATGHRVASLRARADRADLPLIAGEGAAEAAPEALDIIAAAAPIAPQLRGLIRMSGRRWDLVLDRGQRLMLPETEPLAALDRALALDQAEQLFARDITAIDLRSTARPVLRLAPYAMTQSLAARGIAPSVESKL